MDNTDLEKAALLHSKFAAKKEGNRRHAAVGNLFKGPNNITKTNKLKLKEKEYAKQYIMSMSKKISQYNKKDIKNSLRTVIQQLNEGIGKVSTAVGGGNDTKQKNKSVTITIPMIAATILRIILMFILFTLNVFLMFVSDSDTFSDMYNNTPNITSENLSPNILNIQNKSDILTNPMYVGGPDNSREQRIERMKELKGGLRKTKRNRNN
jgi:hypothetical protein